MTSSNPRSEPPIILAVDDTPVNLMVLDSILEENFDLRVATSGKDALAIVTDIAPDLILLDVLMPEMDGYETCRHLKQVDAVKDVPVLFVTAVHDSEVHAKCLEVGGSGVIEKPVNRQKLLEKIATCLGLNP